MSTSTHDIHRSLAATALALLSLAGVTSVARADAGMHTFRLEGGGNAVPSIKGADDVVLEGGYPAHAQTFLDMRDIGFEDYAAEAVVPGLSTDVSDLFLKLYEGKADAQGTLDAVAGLVADKTGE